MRSAPRLSLPWFLVATPQLTDPHFVRSVVLVVDHGEHGAFGFIVNRPLSIGLGEVVGPRDYSIPNSLNAWYGGPVKTDTGIILHQAHASSTPCGGTGIVLTSSELTLRRMCEDMMRRENPGGPNQRHGPSAKDSAMPRPDPRAFTATPIVPSAKLDSLDAWLVDSAKAEHDFAYDHPMHKVTSNAPPLATHGESSSALIPYRFLIGYAGWGEGQLEDELRQGAWLQIPYQSDLLFDTSWQKMWDYAMRHVGTSARKLVATPHTYLN